MRFGSTLVMAVAFAASGATRADEKAAASATVLAELAGTWNIVYAEKGGTDQTKPGVTATFKKNEVALKGGGFKETPVRLTFDPSKKPGWVEIEAPGRDGKETLLGVYRLTPTHFYICFNPDPKGQRPPSIETMKTGNVLLVMKRPKK